MKNIALVVGLLVVLVMGAVLGTSCAKGGGDTPATTMAAAMTTTTTPTTTCPANPTSYPVTFVLTAPDKLTYPPYQVARPCDTIVWTLKNDCPTCDKVKVKIQDRHRRHETKCGQGNTIDEGKDCFKKDNGGNDCKPENADAAYQETKEIGRCTIESVGIQNGLAIGVQNGCYKYDLDVKVKLQGGGPPTTFRVDPEIEVQGGIPLEGQGGPSPRVSPAP